MKQPILMTKEEENEQKEIKEKKTNTDALRLISYRSAVSEDAQVPPHQMQLPVVVLQASGVDISAQGSEGTVKVRSRPKVTPLKPPDRKSRPCQLVMARDTERFTGSPTAETEKTKDRSIGL